MKSASLWLAITALYGVVGVALGAFGAHALRERLEPRQLDSWGTAVEYQLLHTVALLALSLYSATTGRSVGLPAALFALGILLFSGSIYGLVLTPFRWLGPVTPLGGLLLIAGWLSLFSLAREG